MSFLKLNRNILDNPKICYLSQRKVILKLPSTFDILPTCNVICNLDLTNFTLGCSPAPPPAPVGPPPERLFGMKENYWKLETSLYLGKKIEGLNYFCLRIFFH